MAQANVLVSGGPDPVRNFGPGLLLHQYHANEDLRESNRRAMRAYLAEPKPKRAKKSKSSIVNRQSSIPLPDYLLVFPLMTCDAKQKSRSIAAVQAYVATCPLQSERNWWAARLSGENVAGFVHPETARATLGRDAVDAQRRKDAADIEKAKAEEIEALAAVQNAELSSILTEPAETVQLTDDDRIALEDAKHFASEEESPAAEPKPKRKTAVNNEIPIADHGVTLTKEEMEQLELDKEFEGANT